MTKPTNCLNRIGTIVGEFCDGDGFARLALPEKTFAFGVGSGDWETAEQRNREMDQDYPMNMFGSLEDLLD